MKQFWMEVHTLLGMAVLRSRLGKQEFTPGVFYLQGDQDSGQVWFRGPLGELVS